MEKQTMKGRKPFDLKHLIFGSPKQAAAIPGSRFPNGTQSLVPVVDIRQ